MVYEATDCDLLLQKLTISTAHAGYTYVPIDNLSLLILFVWSRQLCSIRRTCDSTTETATQGLQFHFGHHGNSHMEALTHSYVNWPNMNKQLE